MMTKEQQAKILGFAGVWKAGKTLCAGWSHARHCDEAKCGAVRWVHIPHEFDALMPSLEGDYADVVEAKCRRKLNEKGYFVDYWPDGGVVIYGSDSDQRWQGEGFNAAVLAYLEQEGK